MKHIFMFTYFFSCLFLPVQGQKSSVLAKTTTFSYDLSGNIISRKSAPIQLDPVQGGITERPGGEMTIIGGVDGKFTLDLKKDASQTARFSLYNTQPSILMSDKFTSNTYTVDLTDYPAGVYIFNVEVGEKEFSEKVLKE